MDWHRNGDSIQSGGGFVVATRGTYAPEVVDGSHFEADWEESARLIAAAPDMLAACVRMLDSWTLTCETAPYQQRDAIKAIRAAIAKVKGDV